MTATTSKRILFRLTKPPYGTSYAREALDAILATAAFEQKVSILFYGDAVFQLVKQQQPERIQQKNFSAGFGLFPVYGLDQIYVDSTSLQSRNLRFDQLLLPVITLEPQEVRELLRSQDQLISF